VTVEKRNNIYWADKKVSKRNQSEERRVVFILVPSPHPTGPVKGAYALSNALVLYQRVVLVFLKDGPGADSYLDKRVDVISLAKLNGGWFRKLNTYRALLKKAGGRKYVTSISLCLSADWINRFCRSQAVTCASVRGNLDKNYRYDFGLVGRLVAFGHLKSLRSFDHVVAMSDVMSAQIRAVTGVAARVIGNFVDEHFLEFYRASILKERDTLYFVFVGSLSARKKPEVLIDAVAHLIHQGRNVKLDIIGEGPLMPKIERSISEKRLHEHISLHGHMAVPYDLVANADVFVLPSISEGMSRAAMEALYLGVPCVLRDVDGNAGLLSNPASGRVFSVDEELAEVMYGVAVTSRLRCSKLNLLSSRCRQENAAIQYLKMIDGNI